MRKKDIYEKAAALEGQLKQDVLATLDKLFSSRNLEKMLFTGEVLNDSVLNVKKEDAAVLRTLGVLGTLGIWGVLDLALPEDAEPPKLREEYINTAFKASDVFVLSFGRDSLHALQLEKTVLENERAEIDKKLLRLNQRIYRLTK